MGEYQQESPHKRGCEGRTEAKICSTLAKIYYILAERQGFEPWETQRASTVFETAPFNHSGTSPVQHI